MGWLDRGGLESEPEHGVPEQRASGRSPGDEPDIDPAPSRPDGGSRTERIWSMSVRGWSQVPSGVRHVSTFRRWEFN